MTRFCIAATLAVGIVVSAVAHPAFGQSPTFSQGSVSGTGVAVIKRQPDLMRMQLELTATGKDLKDALSKLKARREAALTTCTNLGAAAETLSVSSPQVVDMAQRQRMNGYISSRGSRSPKKPEAAPPVNISAWLKAEWPLKGSSAEELLLSSQSRCDTIRSQLAKSAPKAELSPEQEEMQEENAAEMMNNGNGQKPGDPVFVFVARVSTADFVKAASKAFLIAKAHAQRFADAARLSLGELRNIQGNDADRQSIAMMNYRRQYYNDGMLQEVQEEDSSEAPTGAEEATGTNPGEVRLTIAIAATFSLGK
jgi:uncharacterized protein YggE